MSCFSSFSLTFFLAIISCYYSEYSDVPGSTQGYKALKKIPLKQKRTIVVHQRKLWSTLTSIPNLLMLLMTHLYLF